MAALAPARLVVVFGLLFSVGALAAGNPLGGAMVDESVKQLQSQSSGGLGLTGGGFNPEPPKFSRDGNTITYSESPKGDDQYNVRRQRAFSTTEDGAFYSGGESIFEGAKGTTYADGPQSYSAHTATSETPLFIVPTEEVAAEAQAHGTYSAKQDFQDNWAIGNGWLGASLGYRSVGSNQGNTFSAAWARSTVLGQSTLLMGANLTTNRNYKGTATVSDDTLNFSGNFYLLGQKTALANGEVPLGTKKVFDEIAHFDQKIFKQEWQYFIGPVPVLIRAHLNGKASAGSPVVEAGVAAGGLNEITYWGSVRPYAGLKGQGDVVLGGFTSVPDDLLPAYVKGVVESDFITGNLHAQGWGSSAAKGACLEVKTGDFRTMRTSIWGEAKWDLLQTAFVRTFVDVICDNGFFTIPGCGGVQSFLQQVTNLLTFKKRRDIYQHPGFDLGSSRKWLDVRSCQTNLDPTVLNLCNQNVEPIYSALMLYDAANNFWKSVGWYQLPAKGCRKIPMGNYQNGRVYVYAQYQAGDLEWKGSSAAMCVHKTDKFDINKADSSTSCNGSQYKMVGTTEVMTPANQVTSHNFGAADLAAYKHSIVKFCNRTFHDNIYASMTYFKNTWTSKGWWKVPKDQCTEFDLGPYDGNVFIHGNPATTYGASFGRGWSFCVNDNVAFEYPYITTMGCGVAPNVLKDFSIFTVKKGTNVYDFKNEQTLLTKRVCNHSSAKVWVTKAWDERYAAPDNRSVVGSQGWWELAPDKCMDLRHQTQNDGAYVYAKNEAGKEFPGPSFAGGVRKFCVNPAEKFELHETPATCPQGMVEKTFMASPGTAFISFD